MIEVSVCAWVSVSHHTSAPIAHAANTWRQKLSLPGFILSSQEPLYSGTSRISGEHSNTSMWCTMASLPGVTTDSYWQKQREGCKKKLVKKRELCRFMCYYWLKAEAVLLLFKYVNKNISEIDYMQHTYTYILFCGRFLHWICSHFITLYIPDLFLRGNCEVICLVMCFLKLNYF